MNRIINGEQINNGSGGEFYNNLIYLTIMSSVISIITKNLENIFKAIPYIFYEFV